MEASNFGVFDVKAIDLVKHNFFDVTLRCNFYSSVVYVLCELFVLHYLCTIISRDVLDVNVSAYTKDCMG